MNDNGESNTRPACASCRHQRKGCRSGCVMAPHFPSSNMEEFQGVQQLFGLSNMTKKLQRLDFEQQKIAVDSFKWEAAMWKQHPVHGPFGEYKRLYDIITRLQQENNLLRQQVNFHMDSNYVHNDNLVFASSVNNSNTSHLHGHAQDIRGGMINRSNGNYCHTTITQEANFEDIANFQGGGNFQGTQRNSLKRESYHQYPYNYDHLYNGFEAQGGRYM